MMDMDETQLRTKPEHQTKEKQDQKANKWTPNFYQGLAELGNEMIKRKMKRFNF